MRDKQKRRRERTWAEAAKMVLENYSDAPMTPKQILNVIEAEGLKETKSGSSPLACLNAMLHSNSRTREAMFYKLPGRISLFTMKKNAVQWSRVVSLPDDGDAEDTADEEGSQWTEDSSVPAAETSSSASCSQESHVRETRSLVQMNKQKRRSGVLLPRVVLTPLKVNGAHLPSTSGLSVRRVESESSSNSALRGSLAFHRRSALSGNSTHHLRSLKNISAPGQVRKKEEEIDFETPGSILVNTNLRALINVRMFNALPAHLQQQLLLLLPDVDRQVSPDGQLRMSGSALNNEFFAHACQRWRERLAEGEFTPEAQQRMRQEMGKEKKVEDWKEKFFEDFYGQKLGYLEEPGSDLEDKSYETPCLQQEKPRTNLEPAQKQEVVPDVHIRTRRSLYRNTKKIQRNLPGTAEVKVTTSPPLPLETTESDPSAVESRLSKRDDLSLPSTSERVPELHPEITSEQKRKTTEPEISSPSLEKKPRMEQRQSFRNTIQSVHPEKPQPTKEEPKVPPIRLSRIKPPWVVKGLPAYQIFHRIIPNPDPTGCWPSPCSPSDSQTSDHHSQTSNGEGRGSGNHCHHTSKRRSRSRGSRRRTRKRRHGEKPANRCRTQLLQAVAMMAEKQEVPRVKISLVSSDAGNVHNDHGTNDSLTKEWHLDKVSVLEDSSQNGDKEVPMADKEEENICMSQCSDERMFASSMDGTTGQSFEGTPCVLGDVSNTFQNRLKQVSLCSTEKDSSENKTDAAPADSTEHHVLPTSSLVQPHSLDTAKTLPTGQLPVHVYDPSTPNTTLDFASDPCCNGHPHDNVPCPLVNSSLEPNKSDLPYGAIQAGSLEQTLVPAAENVAFDCFKGNLAVPLPVNVVPCTANVFKEDELPEPEATVGNFSAGTNDGQERLYMHSILSPANLEAGKHGSPGPTTEPSSSPHPFKEMSQGCQDSCGDHKHSLYNSAGFAGKVPLLLGMPFIQFPKEVGVRVELPVDLALSPRNKMDTFLEMLSQDVAAYHYSAGLRLSSMPGDCEVTGSASLSVEVFSGDGGKEQVSLRCSCSFKAMAMCEGCGAFCHIDCIGPSKLCVSCLVIR
ncbi:polycomb group protein ASXL1 isoform X3 [Bufo gargarizans]|uniref:polycomb group protein ASXL1 isoform X3 n=1 Tax=Bufo gargarizans TaxID=30331 RepID=UPI001CF24F13|nr:polycomb group protein ASXL1 isoform X3 [Bufo gargarizans]